jgi:hypothetical protein
VPPLSTPEYATASSSADDLQNAVHFGQSLGPQDAPPHQLHLAPQPYEQPTQFQPQPPVKAKSSTRKLIKNILSGSSANREPSSYDNTSGLARRPSKRASHLPSIQTGTSGVTLEQQQLDWQGTSPLNQHSNTIRQVPGDPDTSPYAPDDLIYPQQGPPPPLHRHQSQGQVNYDSSPLQQPQPAPLQFQSSTSPAKQYSSASQQGEYISHLGPQAQNPETVSQLSHPSPTADSDAQQAANLQSSTTSPSANTPAILTQDIPRRPSQAQSHSQTPVQQKQPPLPLGNAPLQQSEGTLATDPPQDVEQGGMQAPPPGYRYSQAPNMAPPQPGAPPSLPNQTSSLRAGPERQQYESASADGRNSPVPPVPGDAENEKAFKDLRKFLELKRCSSGSWS